MFTVALVVAAAISAGFAKPPYARGDEPRWNGDTGFVLKKMTITPDGHLLRCEALFSNGLPRLKEAACQAVVKARYTPATDQSGTPVHGVFKAMTSYSPTPIGGPTGRMPIFPDVEVYLNRLPKGAKGDRIVTAVTVVVDDRGRIESCDVSDSSGFAQLDALACSSAATSEAIAPVIDAYGSAVRSVQDIQIRFVKGAPPATEGER